MQAKMRLIAFLFLTNCWLSDLKCATDSDCGSGQTCYGGSYGGQGVCSNGIVVAANDYKWNKEHMQPGTEIRQRSQKIKNGRWYECWEVLIQAAIPSLDNSHRTIEPPFLEGPECDEYRKAMCQ